jgi:hypothetical protein
MTDAELEILRPLVSALAKMAIRRAAKAASPLNERAD